MTSPINPVSRSNTAAVTNTNNNQTSANQAKSDASAGKPSSSDSVSLSEKSQQVSSLQQELKNTPEIDSLKIDAIKQEIANGNYPLDPEKIAENMIKLEQSLLE